MTFIFKHPMVSVGVSPPVRWRAKEATFPKELFSERECMGQVQQPSCREVGFSFLMSVTKSEVKVQLKF